MTGKKNLVSLKQIADYMVKSNSFDKVTQKVKITGGGDGRCVAEFVVAPEHLNFVGGLHGGLTATIIDNVTTYALMSKPCHPGLSVDMQVSYFKTAKEGEDIIVDATTINADKSLAYIECELRRKSDGCVIAKGSQTKYIKFD